MDHLHYEKRTDPLWGSLISTVDTIPYTVFAEYHSRWKAQLCPGQLLFTSPLILKFKFLYPLNRVWDPCKWIPAPQSNILIFINNWNINNTVPFYITARYSIWEDEHIRPEKSCFPAARTIVFFVYLLVIGDFSEFSVCFHILKIDFFCIAVIKKKLKKKAKRIMLFL